MTRNDGPFAFTAGTLRIGSGENSVEIPVAPGGIDFAPDVTLQRGTQPWPGPILAGSITITGTITGDLDPWFDFRAWRCPGCGVLFSDLPPGHTWTSASGGKCWNETGPIDKYGRPIKEPGDG